MANLLQSVGRLDEALAICREAIRLRPDFGSAHIILGNIFQCRGEFAAAAAAYRESVRLEPEMVIGHLNLGLALWQCSQLADSIAAYRRATTIEPEHAAAHHRLGTALAANGAVEDAISAFRRSLELNPDDADAQNDLGSALANVGRIDEAVTAFRAAVRLAPEFAEACCNLGNALLDQGQLDEAIAAYEHALRLDSGHAAACTNLGNALHVAGRIDQAIEVLREAVRLAPNLAGAHNNLGNCLKDQGQLDLALGCYRRAALLEPATPTFLSNLIYSLHFHPDYDSMALLAESCRWDQRHARPLEHLIPSHDNVPSIDRPLRVGYVSPDFREHVVGRNVFPLLREHDPQSVEVFCYAAVSHPDSVTAQFRNLASGWRDICHLDPDRAAEVVRNDRIDILVDLTLHMAGSRLPIFARKPAPVQVTYLGYCGTTGLEAMDYRLSDAYLDPPVNDATCYREETIRLPRSYWCYEPLGSAPAVSAVPALAQGCVTFGCLNNFAKISDAAWEVWFEILLAAPRSRLLILVPTGSARQRAVARAGQRGIATDRLEFVDRQRWNIYIQAWQRIDIALDPFPYGGGITSCDALWMGAPVVTLSGKTAVGRGGRSILSNLGLPELVAETPRQYVEIAVALAADLPRLSELRATLRGRMENSRCETRRVLLGTWKRPIARCGAAGVWKGKPHEACAHRRGDQAGSSAPSSGTTDGSGGHLSPSACWAAEPPVALHGLGTLAAQVGQRALAVEMIRRAIALDPCDAETRHNLATILQGAGRQEEAIAAYREAVRLDPERASALNSLGTLLQARGDLDEAVAAFRQALQIEAGSAIFKSNLGNALRAEARTRKRLGPAARRCVSIRVLPVRATIWGCLARRQATERGDRSPSGGGSTCAPGK